MDGLDRTFWNDARERALARDGHRCTVARLLGGRCRGRLHVHHIDPNGAPYDLDNLGTTCAGHHPVWEALRLALVRRVLDERPVCPHQHRTAEARAICEAQLARRRARALVSAA